MPSLAPLLRKWILPEPCAEAHGLAGALGVQPFMAELLWRRGFHESEAARDFLDPKLRSLSDPFELTGLRAGVERLAAALEARERIVVYGDYDVDGITSSALLTRVLQKCGGEVSAFLPHRLDEGYGLTQEGVERCVAERDPQLLVAVDCGTSSAKEIAWLRERGVDAIVIDHHTLPPELPDCCALINPQRDGKMTYLASVGLVFKVCHGLLKLREKQERPLDLRSYLDLVAVGTVADIVPLVGENRIFVAHGLQVLEKSENLGLRTLCQTAQIRGTPTPFDIGFRIGPRLNASGRLGDATRSLTLLLTEDPQEARSLAQELEGRNRERQAVELTTFEEAQKQLEAIYDPDRDWAIVLGGRGWHVGVVGIVASRIQRLCHRPTLIVGFDEEGMGKGSGRSIEGCPLVAGMRACSHHLDRFGGHEMAAGVSLREEALEPFRRDFNAWVKETCDVGMLQPRLALAGALSIHDANEETFAELSKLAPFGRDNPEPVFGFFGVRSQKPPSFFGNNHIKFFLQSSRGVCEAVGFGMAGKPLPTTGAFALAGSLQWDSYRNTVQIRIADWQDAPLPASTSQPAFFAA